MKNNPVIIALDVQSAAEARTLVAQLEGVTNFYKVGMELYASAGIEFVRELVNDGRDLFLDLKFYDIPETVKRAVAQVAKTGVRFLTVHGSSSIMRAAAEGRESSSLQLLAVTLLTSFGPEDLQELGYSGEITTLVENRSRQAVACGMDGLVASPLEAAAIRRTVPAQTILVTPGVRSAGAARGDQRRVATPAEAIRDGADYVVIGRQVTRAADPAAELNRVLDELSAVAR